jgi:hypothetical protein
MLLGSARHVKGKRGDFDSMVRQIPDPAGAEHAISKNMMVWTFGE